MTKELWLNLPVKDTQKAKAFFKQIGFTFKDERETPEMVAMMVGQRPVPVMLCEEKQFQSFSMNEITDTQKSSEILISFDAESRSEVDQIAENVKNAGGNLFSPPSEIQGWMYGCAFADLDGHRWNVLYMDMSKMK